MTEFYRLVKEKLAEDPPGSFRLVTAAVWSCQLCGETIDGMGGPGNGEICVRCGDDIISGKVRMNRAARGEGDDG